MGDDGSSYRRNLFRLNGLDIDGRPLDVLSQSARKGPHRLGRIFGTDQLTLRVTNLRARAGLKPPKFSR